MRNIDKLMPVFGFVALLLVASCSANPGQGAKNRNSSKEPDTLAPVPADQLMDKYLPRLAGKQVGVIANHTSKIGSVHLVDSLLARGVAVKRVFSPEHGFRGRQAAGAQIKGYTDEKTGLPVISLYGKNKKPTAKMLRDLDVLLFDLQDVGARFYTYISTMHYAMEAAAANGLQFMVLDRPNPNGHYVAGPVLKPRLRSFVGMEPIPVVHGLTVGELAKMIVGEGWLDVGKPLDLTVITCRHYSHGNEYTLPVAPSPNLKSQRAVYLYPSLCLFEATGVSVGRGTKTPFEIYGMPGSNVGDFHFTPHSNASAPHPKHLGRECTGYNLAHRYSTNRARRIKCIRIDWLIDMYQANSDNKFFTRPAFFDKLAGTDRVRKMIETGNSAAEIRRSWQKGLEAYKTMRKKYLLYPDFTNDKTRAK